MFKPAAPFPFADHAAAISSAEVLMLSLQKQNILAPVENWSKHCIVNLEEAQYLAANALGFYSWSDVCKKIDSGCLPIYLETMPNQSEVLDEMAQCITDIISNIGDDFTKARVVVALEEAGFGCCPLAQRGAKSNFEGFGDESTSETNYDSGYLVEVRYASARDIYEAEKNGWEQAVKFASKNGLPIPKKPSRPIRFKNIV